MVKKLKIYDRLVINHQLINGLHDEDDEDDEDDGEDFERLDDHEIGELLASLYSSEEFDEYDRSLLRGVESPEPAERDEEPTDDLLLPAVARGLSRRKLRGLRRVRDVQLIGVYGISAIHHRSEPFQSKWKGVIRAIRVQLPNTLDARTDLRVKRDRDVAKIYAKDHNYSINTKIPSKDDKHRRVVLSVESVIECFKARFPEHEVPDVKRVDLITVARAHYHQSRFAPISLFLAYDSVHIEGRTPLFYFVGGASVTGKPQSLYCTPSGNQICGKARFEYTPFGCRENDYDSQLEMKGTHPFKLDVHITRPGADQHHLRLHIMFGHKDINDPMLLSSRKRQRQAIRRSAVIGRAMGSKQAKFALMWEREGRRRYMWLKEPPEPEDAEPSDLTYVGCPFAHDK